jgi:hypothetical protein
MPTPMPCLFCGWDKNPPEATVCASCNLNPRDTGEPTVPLRGSRPAEPPDRAATRPQPARLPAPVAPVLGRAAAHWATLDAALRTTTTWPGRAVAAVRSRWTAWADTPTRRDIVPHLVLLPALTILAVISPALLLIGASLAAAVSNWVLDRKDLLMTSVLTPVCFGFAALVT